MALAKIETSGAAIIDNWVATATKAVRVGATYDMSGLYKADLQIEIAPISANANIASTVIVEVSYADELFVPHMTFSTSAYTAGTAVLERLATAGDGTIDLTDETAGNFGVGERALIWETGTPADSETIYLVSDVADAVSGQEWTLASNLKYSHATAMTIYAVQDQQVVAIPDTAAQVRVILFNEDLADSIANTVRIMGISAL